MDYTLGDTIYHAFTTRAFATGVPTALAGSPTLEIYENDSVTPIVEGASKLVLTQNLNSINGFNLATITATSGNGFEAGKTYHIIVKTGTVGGTSIVGEVVGRFTLQASAAAADLANVTDGLGAIKGVLDTVAVDVAGLDGAAMRGTDSAYTGTPPTVGAIADEVQTRTIAGVTLVATTTNLTNLPGTAALEATLTAMKGATFDGATDSLEAIRNKETDIETDTAEIGAAGAGLTNINLPDQTMNITGDITGNLSGSVGSVTGAVGSVTGAVGSVTGAVGSVTGTVGGIAGTTQTLDALQTAQNAAHGAGSWATATGFSTLTAANVNAEVVDALATDTYAEPTGVPAATIGLAEKVGWLFMALRNGVTITASKKQFLDDGGAVEWEKDLSDDGSTYTETEANAP